MNKAKFNLGINHKREIEGAERPNQADVDQMNDYFMSVGQQSKSTFDDGTQMKQSITTQGDVQPISVQLDTESEE